MDKSSNISHILEIPAFSKEQVAGKKILIWGAWTRGLFYQQALAEEGMEIEAYIDSNSKGQQFGAPEKNVFLPSFLESNEKYYILVAIEEYTSVFAYLEKLGYQEYKDYIYPSKKISVTGIKHGYWDSYGNVIQGNVGKASIQLKGNAKLIIEDHVTLCDDVKIICGWNSCITIGSGSLLRRNTNILTTESNQITIGQHCRFGQRLNMVLNAGSSFVCGDDCLFSYNICVRADHGHAIIDRTEKTCTRGPIHTVLGSHVWVGMGVSILGGTEIGNHCTIGAGSLVQKAFPYDYVTLAGVPAKVIKENTDWLFDDQATYEDYLDYFQNSDMPD